MDQAIVTATTEFLNNQISSLQESVRLKDEHIQRITQRDYSTKAELVMMRDNMQDWTMTALQNERISEDVAEEIAEICGFELTKEVEVEVTVTYTMTVNAGANEDVEDIVNDIPFDSIDYDTDKISWLNVSVDRIDF